MKHIPNILTSLRIVLTAVFAWQFFRALEIASDPANSVGVGAFWMPLMIYAVAFLTDILDGFLARTFNWVTPVGKLLDPLADKLMGLTALVCILFGKTAQARFSVVYVVPLVLMFVKEAMMFVGVLNMLRQHKVAYADWYGKIATGVFTGGVVLTLLSFALPVIEPWNIVVLAIAVCMSWVAMIHYAKTQLFAKPEDKPEGEAYRKDEQRLFDTVDRLGVRQNPQGVEEKSK